MAFDVEKDQQYTQEDHQVAFVFDPDADEADHHERPSKRRRLLKQSPRVAEDDDEGTSHFVPLLNGAESAECVRARERLFHLSWETVHERIRAILRESNSATLEQVRLFVRASKHESSGMSIDDQVPAAFIITGPDIAAQDLLFEQLSETLQRDSPSRFVRLRSSEASSLKTILKRIIQATTAISSENGSDEVQVGEVGNEVRHLLNYDLEALHASIRLQPCDHVFVAFQDSEGFESGLLSELIPLFSSWRSRIPFTLLFGVATSVELLQARLLKSSCRLVYGGQFDVVQADTILERLFKSVVAATDAPVVLGAPLLRSLLDRQRNQVAGIRAFISSLKYAYMCHFYANPLSVLMASEISKPGVLQAEHFEAMRNTASFRKHIEVAVGSPESSGLQDAKRLIEEDSCLFVLVKEVAHKKQQWAERFLRALHIAELAGGFTGPFSDEYVEALDGGTASEAARRMVSHTQQLEADDLAHLMRRLARLLKEGDASVRLGPVTSDCDLLLLEHLESQLRALEALQAKAARDGFTLRGRCSGRGKVMRTTVIAQRVRLSQDSADLRDEDRKVGEMTDELIDRLARHVEAPGPTHCFASESWLYDSKRPCRDVLVPQPQGVFERGLSRPHDYLACSCCASGQVAAMLPPTCILYQLYREAGQLINVADLWAAFAAVVSDKGEDRGDAGEDAGRKALMLFYQGLAELRCMGFLRASRKKADHVAKVKWL